MEKVLFISNQLFVDPGSKNGGVKICTEEFIDLLRTNFEVIVFPVRYKFSFIYRIQVRLGLNVYNDYAPGEYTKELKDFIEQNKIRFVFLNLSNTITFSPVLRSIGGDGIKLILCSHGNETGDLLHEAVRLRDQAKPPVLFFSDLTIGRLLKKEAFYRYKYIDLVLTISEVEENIEKWIGAKNTFMVPRVITTEDSRWEPVLNRVGFFGDLSHGPNYAGIISICAELEKQKVPVEFRLIGAPEAAGREIQQKYPFVKYLGYLPEQDLKNEVLTWSYFLNLVFYYSRGVSTKLAKVIGLGLPVISTVQGNRGYRWSSGQMLTATGPKNMAELITQNINRRDLIEAHKAETDKIINSSPHLEDIMS